ncbi:MAG: hypothetical protein NZO16_06245 [Deltaproteobacteria bacterium]|nr:hypothetical protein [Deltaproteobacteria bacterium]
MFALKVDQILPNPNISVYRQAICCQSPDKVLILGGSNTHPNELFNPCKGAKIISGNSSCLFVTSHAGLPKNGRCEEFEFKFDPPYFDLTTNANPFCRICIPYNAKIIGFLIRYKSDQNNLSTCNLGVAMSGLVILEMKDSHENQSRYQVFRLNSSNGDLTPIITAAKIEIFSIGGKVYLLAQQDDGHGLFRIDLTSLQLISCGILHSPPESFLFQSDLDYLLLEMLNENGKAFVFYANKLGEFFFPVDTRNQELLGVSATANQILLVSRNIRDELQDSKLTLNLISGSGEVISSVFVNLKEKINRVFAKQLENKPVLIMVGDESTYVVYPQNNVVRIQKFAGLLTIDCVADKMELYIRSFDKSSGRQRIFRVRQILNGEALYLESLFEMNNPNLNPSFIGIINYGNHRYPILVDYDKNLIVVGSKIVRVDGSLEDVRLVGEMILVTLRNFEQPSQNTQFLILTPCDRDFFGSLYPRRAEI